LAVAKNNGASRWSAKGSGDWGNVRSTPVLVGDLLIYAEPYSGDVVAISSTTGRVIYRHTLGACYFPQWASPAAAADVVYVMRFDGIVHALRATDGKSLWRFYLGDSARAGVTIPAELEPNRQCDWSVPTGHPAYSPLAIAADGTLLAGTHEGYLYAIREARP
jgi:outer membrane protein assembly factor BamB